MTAQPGVADEVVPLGDETLVGTQLEVISRVQDGAVSKKFQITSAVGLSFADARDFQSAFPDATAAAVGILRRVGTRNPRFLAVLDDVFGTSDDFVPPNFLQFFGRGGFPNLRLIFDFRADVPTATFQIHTILDFKTADGPDRLEEALPRGDLADVLTLVERHCVIDNATHLEGMLRGALS